MKGSSCGMKKGMKAGGMAKMGAMDKGMPMKKAAPKASTKGGKSNMDMKMFGRNMAKMKAQGK